MDTVRRKRRLIGVLFAVALAVGIAALGFWLASTAGRTDRLEYYRMMDPDTIIIGVVSGRIAWTRVTDVAETGSEVRITVRTIDNPLPATGQGFPIELTVDLDEPLGHRVVVDGTWEVPCYGEGATWERQGKGADCYPHLGGTPFGPT
jgi:hypothetical protein